VIPKNDVGLEIQSRTQTVNRCFHVTWHVRKKLTIYKTLIRLVLLYSSETWVLENRKESDYSSLREKFSARYMAQK
jgi:hypothetical protein